MTENPTALTSEAIEKLSAALADCQIADVHRLRRRLRKLARSGSTRNLSQQLGQLEQAISLSVAACQQRAQAIPSTFDYPEQLPFSEKAAEIVELVKQHQVLIVAGDTGSGKTTQLPKICLQAGLGRKGLIGHTQPRRLAAVSVANRISDELAVTLGAGVGYQIRFNERMAANSFLKIMTDGILLTEIQQDRFLNKYEVIIIDEAHERSLNIDFLLGYLRWLIAKRSDLKVIITSATIDVEKFSEHFDDAPVVLVSGRTYPVEVRYAPLLTDRDGLDSADLQTQGIISAIEEIEAHDKSQQKLSGDVLVFLPTERDIRDTATALRKQRFADTEVLPLYARLRHSEQVRIFQAHKGRRIVLSTNVAETSLTVPGINYVIDTGLARISRYSLQNKVQRLPIEAVSQASANQRKGRCGRVADGICIRLYSESDFESRPQFTDPEILRTNLASVILRMQHLGLGDVAAFPFLEPPATKAINDGFKLLVELSALNNKRELTTAGKQMARLPVDPKYARMLVTADQERCLTELLIIVSALSIQDPREQGSENRQLALERQQRFNHVDSDFLSLVNLWNQYEEERQKSTQGQLRKFCKFHHLAFLRMREWRELHRQLMLACQQLGFRLNKDPASYAAVHKSIISGSLNQIAMCYEGKTYQGSRNKKFKLLSSSVLSAKQARWIVTGDQIETSQTFASMAAKIQPEWVEEKALHLVKREYFDPHWSKKQQAVFAYEKVSLYGLVIVERKPVPFAPIDSGSAHSIFVKEALANGEVYLDGKLGHFLRANDEFLQDLAKQEEKIRKPEHFVSESDIANFYEARIPDDISSTAALRHWLRETRPAERAVLEMDMESLFGDQASRFTDSTHVQYPDQAPVNQNRLTIDYLFEPGHARDGATVEIPLEVLPQISQADIDWAVPGIIAEKCTALIKALPKSLRKNFIPVSGFVSEIIPQMLPGEMDFISALLAQIRRVKKLDIARSDFASAELPEHLRIKVRVVGEKGEELAFGEDIKSLKKELASQLNVDPKGTSTTNSQLHELETTGLKDWTIQELPPKIEIGEELVLLRYPALVDDSDSVSVKLFSEKLQAEAAHRRGLIRLFKFRSSQQRRMLEKQFTQFFGKHALKLPGDSSALTEQAVLACYRAAFEVDTAVVRDKQAFDDRLNVGKQALFQRSGELESLLTRLLDSRLAVRQSLETLKGSKLDYVITDISAQLQEMFGTGFLVDTPWIWLQQYPRYLDAVLKRLEKAPHLGPRDRQFTEELDLYWRRYQELCDRKHIEQEEEIDSFRWMIEEYRVSLFAQSLGTRVPVSAKRLEKALAALQ